eukprot:COSAG02_NODE_65159_length_258_cov_1.622642_1_plen_22_part_10
MIHAMRTGDEHASFSDSDSLDS